MIFIQERIRAGNVCLITIYTVKNIQISPCALSCKLMELCIGKFVRLHFLVACFLASPVPAVGKLQALQHTCVLPVEPKEQLLPQATTCLLVITLVNNGSLLTI